MNRSRISCWITNSAKPLWHSVIEWELLSNVECTDFKNSIFEKILWSCLRSRGQMMIKVKISSNSKTKGSLLFQLLKTRCLKQNLASVTSKHDLFISTIPQRPHCFFIIPKEKESHICHQFDQTNGPLPLLVFTHLVLSTFLQCEAHSQYPPHSTLKVTPSPHSHPTHTHC